MILDNVVLVSLVVVLVVVFVVVLVVVLVGLIVLHCLYGLWHRLH